MKWYPYGHDFGNAEMRGVTVLQGMNVSRRSRTAFAKADVNAMHNLGVKVDQSDTHVMSFHGEAMAYAVGELALQQAVDVYFFSSRRRHTRLQGDWSSDVCSSD